MILRPIGKNILISIEKELTPEPGKLFIPKSNKEEKVRECFVVAIGNDCHLDIKIGDKIFLKPYNQAFLSHETKDKLFYIAIPEDVLGVFDEN